MNRLAIAAACGVLLFGVAFAPGCGGDDDDDDGAAGTGFSGSGGTKAAGSGGMGGATSGSGGSMQTGGSGGTKAAGSGGSSAGSGGTMSMPDAGPEPDCETEGCPEGEYCVDGECVEMCDDDDQCDSGESCCEGACTDTEDDGDNCGACGTECDDTETCVESECVALVCEVDPDADAGVELESNGCPENEQCIEENGTGTCHCGDSPSCPVHENCDENGECLCGENPGCDTDQGCCDGDCVDIERDEDNCGACGVECATGATCVAGKCECDTEGYGACNGRCVALDDEDNCGECGNECESPATCRDPSGSRPLGCYCPNVNEVPCNGVCVALGTTTNCGECGDTCESPASTCRNNQCECPTAGQTACGNSCVDLDNGVDLDPDAEDTLFNHCGSCDLTCMANAACDDGVCACPGGPTTDMYCDEDPITGSTDSVYECIEVSSTKSCGACGNACLDDSECQANGTPNSPDDYSCECVDSDEGKTHCPGEGCKDLDNDANNCGTCGHACPKDIDCDDGTCDCPGGATADSCLVDGAPKCVDLATDNNNCGECGRVCGNGFDCCDGTCVDIDNFDDDESNCGACGVECPDFGCGFLGLGACACNNGDCQN